MSRRNAGRGRFAPSTTGRAHPGTLLAALLCWLDARSKGAEILLRLEDLDRDRTRPGFLDSMMQDLAWFGLDWDAVVRQSDRIERYEARTEGLVAAGRVYACRCSRKQIRERGRPAPDGGYRYGGTCRERIVTREAWRESKGPLRLRLDAGLRQGRVEIRDESGLDLSGDPERLFGDPLLRRRDGAFAYHFASVIDDDASAIDRIVRGRDLAPSTILQAGVRSVLGLSNPAYRHHPLLLESSGGKLSKLHGAVDVRSLARHYDAAELCGRLAHFIGLVPMGTRCRPADLLAEFGWERVDPEDVVLEWSETDGLRALKQD